MLWFQTNEKSRQETGIIWSLNYQRTFSSVAVVSCLPCVFSNAGLLLILPSVPFEIVWGDESGHSISQRH